MLHRAIELVVAALCVQQAHACTALVAGRKATANGATFLLHTDEYGGKPRTERVATAPSPNDWHECASLAAAVSTVTSGWRACRHCRQRRRHKISL